MIAIAEPVSRLRHIHEYKLTSYSLNAAVSTGVLPDQIIASLSYFCKTSVLPQNIIQYITTKTQNCGKVKLTLKNNRYYVESEDVEILQQMIANSETAELLELGNHHGENSIAVRPGMIQRLQQLSLQMETPCPLVSKYEYHQDTETADIETLKLKPSVIMRPYQEHSLNKMFSNSAARSGIIVLPCGAGKTLVGVAAACTIQKRCLCLVTSNVAADQWKSEFMTWSEIDERSICNITAESQTTPDNPAGVYITTYAMMSTNSSKVSWMQAHEWSLIILDEVQTVPADTFRRVLARVNSHCRLGLTATLVREDKKITDLEFLIGPKLFEADWMELQDKGYIAKVFCVEVRCLMTPEFYREYLKAHHVEKQQILYTMNPNKFRACQFLITSHESRGDKIIVFSDNLFALQHYARALKRPYIYGETSHEERQHILQNFMHNPAVNTIFVSKVADTSFNLPQANVLIQISAHGGSRRQEAQRMGRICRAKSTDNAYFYSLVSQDTTEMTYSQKRQKFLLSQGYTYKIVSSSQFTRNQHLIYCTKSEQTRLLQIVLQQCV